jgi:hypothetical protein
MTAYKNRLGLMIAMATCIVALAVPAAGRAASITRCDIRAGKPDQDGHNLLYGSKITCNGSVTLDDLVTQLQKRSAGGWHVVAQQDWGSVEVRHHHGFWTWKDCRNSGTFRSKGIMTKGVNSEEDVSAEVHLHCP